MLYRYSFYQASFGYKPLEIISEGLQNVHIEKDLGYNFLSL